MLKQLFISAFMYLLFATCKVSAQSVETIQLLDEISGEYIEGASFIYGSQNGISDQQGQIALIPGSTDTLFLSHLNYGNWYVLPSDLQVVYKKGIITKLADYQSIQPATIIAVHNQGGVSESKSLDFQDKLSHDGGAILTSIPAISMIRKSGSYGFDPVIRGFKHDQLNIVLDGSLVALAACPNRMDPPTSQVAPNMISMVEVFKGPHSLRFGNSFGGTVNFVSSPVHFSEKPVIVGRASVSYESNGSTFRSEAKTGISQARTSFNLFASLSQGDDYTDGNGNRVPSSFNRNSVAANLGIKVAANQIVELSGTRNFARDVIFPALPMDLRSDDTWLLQVKHKATIHKGSLKSWNTNLFGSHVDHFMDNRLKDMNPRMMDAETPAETKNYGARTEGTWMRANSTLYLGADLRIEEAKGTRTRYFLMGPMAGNSVSDNAWQNAKTNKVSVFGEYKYNFIADAVIVSARLEYNEASIKDADAAFIALYPHASATQFNPSLSVGGVHSFTKNYSLGLWLGRSQRSAGITERYINYFPVGLDPYEMLGNPTLDPEVNNQADLVFRGKTKSLAFELNLFYSMLTNYISSRIDTALSTRLPNSPGVRQYLNIGKASVSGFELSCNHTISSALHHRISAAYTYGLNMESNKALPEIAPLDIRYHIAGNYLNRKLHASIDLRFVASQNRISSEFGETPSPSFVLADLNISYDILTNLNVRFSIRNVFDKYYYEHLNRSVRGEQNAIYAPGRNFVVSISYDLQ